MIKTHQKSKFVYIRADDISRYKVLQFEQCARKTSEYQCVIAETISDADAKEEYYTKAEVDAIKSEYKKTILIDAVALEEKLRRYYGVDAEHPTALGLSADAIAALSAIDEAKEVKLNE